MVFSLAELLARAPLQRRDDWLSVSLAAAAATTAAVALLLYSRHHPSDKGVSSELPSPESTLPILGNTLDTMKKQRTRLYDWLSDESLRHGGAPWQLRVLGRPRAIVVTSAALFEDILKTQKDIFMKGELSTFLLRDFFGRGILAVEGDEWFFQRKTASHLFSSQMMKNVMSDVITEKILQFHDVLLAHATGSEAHEQKQPRPISFRRVVTHFTSDVFAKIGFGVELGCLGSTFQNENENENENGNEFVKAFSFCAQVLQRRLQQPIWLWRFKRFMNIGDEKKYKQNMQVIDALLYKIIATSVANKQQHETTKAPVKDLITFFLESQVDRPQGQEPAAASGSDTQLTQIRDLVVNFIFAGKDTTSNSMSWFIVMMNRYPQVAKKIRDELASKLPGMFTQQLVVPRIEELQQLTYLEAAIRENLRLNPPVAVTARTAIAPTVLSDGTVVHTGDRVVLATYAASRQPTVWGEDAAQFNPDRWLEDAGNGPLKSFSPFQFSSFLAGPRICIGQKFAFLEMKMTLAVLMARFELTTVEDPWRHTYEIALTCPVDGPLMVNVKPLV